MKKAVRHILSILHPARGVGKGAFLLSLILSLNSCDLLDFPVNGNLSQSTAEMMLNFDTAYVMQGDTFSLQPVFKPDTLNITDIYVRSSDYDIVNVNIQTGRIEAVGTGWVTLYVESVSARLTDSCTVCVMAPWELTADKEYPYETIFYADVTFNGQALTDGMAVGAFVGDECRGVGKPLSFHGVGLMQFRVGAEELVDDTAVPDLDDDEDDDSGGYAIVRDKIVFRCYDSRRRQLYECPTKIDFDGETHGTLSQLYKIAF